MSSVLSNVAVKAKPSINPAIVSKPLIILFSKNFTSLLYYSQKIYFLNSFLGVLTLIYSKNYKITIQSIDMAHFEEK
jgi:hypothetical protein